jgi:transposase-like protein
MFGDNPKAEAKSLITLLAQGHSVDSLRKTIAWDPKSDDARSRNLRRATALEFDLLALRVSPKELKKGKIKFLRNTNTSEPSKLLCAVVSELLRKGVPHKLIRKQFPVPVRTIAQLSKQIGAAYSKGRTKGRRFTPQFRKKLCQAIASGKRSALIAQEFNIDRGTVTRIRRKLGLEDPTWRKLSVQQIAQAEEQLRAGGTWQGVARRLGCSTSYLLRSCHYRKHSHRPFTRKETAFVLAVLEHGEGMRRLAEQMGRARSSVFYLAKALRRKHPELPKDRFEAKRRALGGEKWKTKAA